MATCPTCEAEFTPNPERSAQTYCRTACKERAAARRRRAPIVAANRAARHAARAARAAPPPRSCVECGGTVASPRGLVCSDLCRGNRKRRMDREYNQTRPGANPRTPECESCGGPRLSDRWRRMCDPCVQEAERQRKRRSKRRRRALKLGVPSEPYTLAQIATRDHFRCGLCRKRVAMTQVVPHPKAPTIDHIVPMAHGGDDTRANVQLAHFLCNSLKCTQGTQQLALLG